MIQIGSAKIYNIFIALTKKLEIYEKCDLGGLKQKRRSQRLRIDVGEGGLEPPNGFPDRFTVCCNCHYATPPDIKEPLSFLTLQNYIFFLLLMQKPQKFSQLCTI